jgi:hypothetical protein
VDKLENDMNDRELIEAAAKAAGITVLPPSRWPVGQEQFGLLIQVGEHRTAVGWWNPLTDDGAALQLAVKLRLAVDVGSQAAHAYSDNPGEVEPHGTDPYAATRRAIVRAAAEMAA